MKYNAAQIMRVLALLFFLSPLIGCDNEETRRQSEWKKMFCWDRGYGFVDGRYCLNQYGQYLSINSIIHMESVGVEPR
jgi:hypothetical protein